MNTEKLFDLLASHVNLSPGLKAEIGQLLREEYYKNHQILHAAGQLENRLYFIESGLMRNYYYDRHGNEHTVKFWQPADIFFSYQGYYGVPSYFYTEVIEPATLVALSYSSLHSLDLKYPETSELIKGILLSYQHQEYETQKLTALQPEERYLELRAKHPNLFKKVPAKMIASYLHLTRETLTRYISRH